MVATMLLRFIKGKNRPGILTCVRDDGSCTWQRCSAFFAYHDLIHYAVETTLGFSEAFFGLVARGKGLDDFGTRNGIKDTYTVEEGLAEHIVGALQYAGTPGFTDRSAAEFLDALTHSCAGLNYPAPAVTLEQITGIRALVADLHRQWDDLPDGETLELVF